MKQLKREEDDEKEGQGRRSIRKRREREAGQMSIRIQTDALDTNPNLRQKLRTSLRQNSCFR